MNVISIKRIKNSIWNTGNQLDTLRCLKSTALRALYRHNDDYFLFGTDTPWYDQAHYVKLIQNSETLTQDQKDTLFFKNILKLIDLP